jgi:hypothetical protein
MSQTFDINFRTTDNITFRYINNTLLVQATPEPQPIQLPPVQPIQSPLVQPIQSPPVQPIQIRPPVQPIQIIPPVAQSQSPPVQPVQPIQIRPPVQPIQIRPPVQPVQIRLEPRVEVSRSYTEITRCVIDNYDHCLIKNPTITVVLCKIYEFIIKQGKLEDLLQYSTLIVDNKLGNYQQNKNYRVGKKEQSGREYFPKLNLTIFYNRPIYNYIEEIRNLKFLFKIPCLITFDVYRKHNANNPLINNV